MRALGALIARLCDVTHGSVRERPDWKARKAKLPVPFDTYHRDDQPDDVRRALGLRGVRRSFVGSYRSRGESSRARLAELSALIDFAPRRSAAMAGCGLRLSRAGSAR
jgi:hypothetical protein